MTKLLWILAGIGLLGGLACSDPVPEVPRATTEAEVWVDVLRDDTPLDFTTYWPYLLSGPYAGTPGIEKMQAGARSVALARLPGDEWLRIPEGWIRADAVQVIGGALEQISIVLTRGLWLLSPDGNHDPLQITEYAAWNSWQWDPQGGAIWYRRPAMGSSGQDVGKISRYVVGGDGSERKTGRIDYQLAGDLLAAPVGGAVLVREHSLQTYPIGNVYILDNDGSTHLIGSQCYVHFSDSYHPFGLDAAWSPDGRYVVLKNRTGELCGSAQTSIYDRSGLIVRDLSDHENPYRQPWNDPPAFADQLGMDYECWEIPPRAHLSSRSRCLWSPDGRWFATMPGLVDNPHIGELLIYSSDGVLVRRLLVLGWPCNAFPWSPDSRWLAYGGPSGCA